MPIGAAAALGLLGAGFQGAGLISGLSARKRAEEAEKQRVENLADELDVLRDNATALREARDVPSELFAELLGQFPGLLDSILPQLTETSIQTTDRLAGAGTEQFLRLRERIAPGTSSLDADRLEQVNRLNPDALGQEDILSITRKLSPLIPSGTLDPNTGAVAGATTNPVSLYRNLISSEFNERRTQFLSEAGAFVGAQNNAAQRQQVSAADFLSENLDRAFQSSALLSAADIEQQQLDIDAQERFILLASQGLQSGLDQSQNNALVSSASSGLVDSLGSAINSLSQRNRQ